MAAKRIKYAGVTYTLVEATDKMHYEPNYGKCKACGSKNTKIKELLVCSNKKCSNSYAAKMKRHLPLSGMRKPKSK